MRLKTLLLAAALSCPLAGRAQQVAPTPDGSLMGSSIMGCIRKSDGKAVPCSPDVPLAAIDANSAAFQGVVAITPGSATTAQRSLGFVCTTGGNVTLTLADGSNITLGIVSSPVFQSLPFAVTNVALGTGTAGTFWGLK